MAYGNFGANSYELNEAAKQQAYAQQQAQMAAQRQAEQQAYERQRQAFQEQMIAQEQARRNAESQASIANAKFELQQRHRRDPHATLKQQALVQTQNEPAMENARQYGRAIDRMGQSQDKMTDAIAQIGSGMFGQGNGQHPSVSLYDNNGSPIGGSGYRSGGYGQGGMAPFRQSLLGK